VSSGNRIHQLLASAGIDWRQPISSFIERYGVTRCPWLEIDIVLVAEGEPILHGLLRPLEFRVRPDWAVDQPPLDFFGLVSVASDWAANFDAAQSELAAKLGTAESDDNANSRARRWRNGNAEIEIRSWPPELQYPSINYMHERDPRTKTACHVTIATGYRPECTPAERELLNSFCEVARLPLAPLRISEGPSQYELEYYRALPSDLGRLAGRIGRAGDRLFWARRDLHAVPFEEIRNVKLIRCHPARGPGYGAVELVCASSAADGREKTLQLGTDPAPDGLDEWAAALADSLGRPLAIEDCYDD
jgi:hypothetical protein